MCTIIPTYTKQSPKLYQHGSHFPPLGFAKRPLEPFCLAFAVKSSRLNQSVAVLEVLQNQDLDGGPFLFGAVLLFKHWLGILFLKQYIIEKRLGSTRVNQSVAVL